MKLELKYLSAYLPYGVNGNWIDENGKGWIHDLIGLNSRGDMQVLLMACDGSVNWYNIKEFKPILRPLTDLTKEIEHNGEKVVFVEYLEENSPIAFNPIKELVEPLMENINWISHVEYYLIQHLLSWHFDCFSLIDNDLAININSLK